MKKYVVSFVYYARIGSEIEVIHTLDIIMANSKEKAIKISKKNHKHDIKKHYRASIFIKEI